MIAPSQTSEGPAAPRPAVAGVSQLSGAEQLELYRAQLHRQVQKSREAFYAQPTLLLPAAAAAGLLLGWVVKRSPLFRRR